MPSQQRDLRIDFFRGLALIFIFIDHIPENVLSYFTPQALQFYDAAEVFIFISGYTAALVYGRTLALQGALYATAQILRRAWQLYVAHIFLFMIFIAEVSYTVTTFNNPMYNDEMRVADFLQEPHVAIVKALLLQFQPTFLDILPLYILLLVIFPVILLGLRLQLLLVLIPSFLVYAAVQVTDLSVPAYPEGHAWYFNPLAWQFLFTAGAALGLGQALRDRGAVEDDEGARRAGSGLVERFGQNLLPCPGLPLDDDRQVGRRQPLAKRVQPPHRCAPSDEPAEVVGIGRRSDGLVCALNAHGGRSELHHLVPLKEHLYNAHAIHDRAVG